LSSPRTRHLRISVGASESSTSVYGEAFFNSLLVVGVGSYNIYLGVAVFLCLVVLLLLLMRRKLKLDLDVLDDPNDNRLIGKRRERGSYHDRN